MVYCLKLPHLIKQLYLVFNIIKLMAISKNLIPDWRMEVLPLSVVIDREEEWM